MAASSSHIPYTPSLIDIEDYFKHPPEISKKPVPTEPYTGPEYYLSDEHTALLAGGQPVGNIKFRRESSGKVTISYKDERTGEYHCRVDMFPPGVEDKMIRALHVLREDMTPAEILDRAVEIYLEICMRNDCGYPPNPDTNVMMHSARGLYHAIAVY